MKKTNRSFAFILALITAMSYSPSHAGFFSRSSNESDEQKEQMKQTSTTSAPESKELLQKLVNTVSDNFTKLNTLMIQGQYQAAMTLAKQSLDEARIKTGLDPKSNRKEIIVVPAGTLVPEYDRMGKNLNAFSISTQNEIIKSIETHKAGYFLDLLNLLKRTNLVYIQAFQQVTKKSSVGLLKQDIEKIKNDINAVRAVPLYLQDPKVKDLLLIFDYEVANSDQNYMFNRELKIYLLSQGKDLGYSGEPLEQVIDAEFNEYIKLKIKNFINSEKGVTPNQEKTTSENPFQNKDFKVCFKYNWDQNNATRKGIQNYCIQNYKRINYNSRTFIGCFDYAWDGIWRSSHNTAMSCEKFAQY